MYKKSIIFLISILIIPFAWAEGSIELEKIVVTPTKFQDRIKDLPMSVSVISKDEIEGSLANSSLDILNTLPGVFVHKTGDFGRADVVIRGQGSRGRRVMVLVDGKPEKMSLFGCTITHSLPLDNIEKIEVVRGSASLLYGSDALGGVINIITKKPKEKNEGDILTSYGSYDTVISRIRQGGNFEKFNYYFTFDNRRSRGHLPNSDYSGKDFSLRLGSVLNDNLEATFTSRYFDGFKREPPPAPSDTWNDYERGAFDLTFNGKWDILESVLKIYRNFGEHIFKDGWHSKDYTNGGIFHITLLPFENNSILSGVEFRREGGEVLGGSGVTLGEYKRDEYAIFLQDRQKFFNDKLIATGGIRYNNDELTGDSISPFFGLNFHLTDSTTLRSSVSRGFRSPALNELRFQKQANPDLKPESSLNYEIGFNQKLMDNLSLDFTYFIMKAKDLIRIEGVGPAAKFRNIDRVEFKGIETFLEYQFLNELSLRLSYTHLNSKRFTQGRPENELDLSLIYKKDRFGFSLTGQCVDNYFAKDNRESALPNFFVVDTKLSYNISKSLEVYFGINNIFNTEYKIYVDLPGLEAGVYTQPKRNFILGLIYRW